MSSKRYEVEGHDINKFQQYYTQEDGSGFSLEDPPQKIYYFNKYGGWKDEVNGKVYYYDQDCNPWIENVPSDIDAPQESYGQDGQEGANPSDRYSEQIQQDLKDYSASSDEASDMDDDEEEKALNEMTSSDEEDNQRDQPKQQPLKSNSQQNKQEGAGIVYMEKKEVEEEVKDSKNEDDQEDEEDNEDSHNYGKRDSNHQTDESADSERFREEYIGELVDVIEQNEIETTCIHIEKVPAEISEKDLLESFGITKEQSSQILHVFYSPIEREYPDEEDEEDEDNNDGQNEQEEIEVKNAVIVVSNKELAKILVQNEGKSLVGHDDRSLYLDILQQEKEYFPMPTLSDELYKQLIEVIKQVLLPASPYQYIQLHLVNSDWQKLFLDLQQQCPSLNTNKLADLVVEVSLTDKQNGLNDLYKVWNQLFTSSATQTIKSITLL